MSKSVVEIVAPYYCQIALRLCGQARQLCEAKMCAQRADICQFVSTLCKEKGFSTCSDESNICEKTATLCKETRAGSDECLEADKLCTEAKRLCPRNYDIQGG